jgi:hypothetical protein
MKKSVITYLMFLLCCYTSQAQDVKVKASVDTARILIGDAIKLTLSAEYDPSKFKVQFPLPNDTFNHFELVEKGKPDTIAGRENSVITQQLTITHFDSGQWYIPAFGFIISPLQGQTPYSLLTDSIPVMVNTIAVDTSKPFKPIYEIREARMPLIQKMKYIAAALLAAALAGLLIFYLIKKYRNKNKQTVAAENEIKLPPHEKALQAFESLEAAQWWLEGREKDYHTALTDIMRTYLEEQFSLDCFEKTSSEIISQVKKTRALSNCRKELRHIFETADMVKFAKSTPSADQHAECLQLAKEVIVESYKKIKPSEDQTAAS